MLNIDLKKEAYDMTKSVLERNKGRSIDEIVDFVFETLTDAMKEDFGIDDFEEFSMDECIKISQGIDEAINGYKN